MRYTLFLILSFFVSNIIAQETSDIKVTYSIKDAKLEQIFSDLETQYGIRFSYATSSIEDKMVAANFEDVPIIEVLDYLLSDEEMEYKIVSNNILIRKASTYKEVKNKDYKASLHIRGKIINSHNNEETLDYATISISNTSIGAYSDANGNFDIEIPEEHFNKNIIVQYLGYKNEVYKISELDNEYIIVSMKDGQFSFDEVMIVNKEKPIKLGNINNSIQLNGSQIASSTSGVMGGDIGRQIQLLPGIAAHDDNSAAIKIRGSNSDETLMILDGMPIYNANHYYGIFSGVNTAYIDSVNIYKNTYPLEYGGRTAGLVELFSNTNQPNKTEASFNLDFLTTSVKARIPISTKSHFSIAGRSTIKEVNNKQFNTLKDPTQNNPLVQTFSQMVDNRKSDPSFTFYDLNAKYQYRNNKNDMLSFNVFRSSDQVNNSNKITINDLNNNEVKLVAINDQSWSNTSASMIFSKSFRPNIRLNTSTYFTQYKNAEINEFKLDKKYKPGDLPPPSDNPLTADLDSEQKNELLDLSFDSHLDYIFKKQTLKFGLTSTHHAIDYLFAENKKDKLTGVDHFLEISGYIGHTMQLWDKVNFRSGFRATYFSNIKKTKFSPRFLLNYQATDRLSFKTSFAIENQVIRQFYYEYRGEPMELWVSAGLNDIPVLRSQNVMLGSTLKLDYFSLDVEFFQKDMKGVLEYFLPNPGEASNNPDQNREYSLFTGNGFNRGIDIILSSGYKKYDTYLSYTLSKCEQQFKEIYNNKFFASENDRTHQMKWVNTLSTGNFTFGINAIYVSGRPYTDIRNVGPNGDVRELNPKNRLKRLKAYHRVDVSSTYAFKLGKLDASITASVFNLMDTKNVKYIQSVSTQVNANQKSENIVIGNESSLLNRTFNLGLIVGF